MTESEPKQMPIAEFRDCGLLQEINRRILHPLGLAMFINMNDDGSASLGGILDERHDPEGWIFGEIDGAFIDKALNVERMGDDRFAARMAITGYFVQPLVKSK